MIMPSKVYPALDSALAKKKVADNMISCSIEVCPKDMKKSGTLNIYMVYGEKAKSYMLTL